MDHQYQNLGKPIIGMCGGIGSGKSAVAAIFKSLGCGIIDADALAKQALDSPESISQVKQWWGGHLVITDASGDQVVDKKALGQIIFDDPTQKEKLEALIHPQVHQLREIKRQQFASDKQIKAIVEDCPLLYEVGLDKVCDFVVFVKASRQTRLHRVCKNRGWDPTELDKREKLQIPLDKKEQKADYMVENDTSRHACENHVRGIFSQILHRYPQP